MATENQEIYLDNSATTQVLPEVAARVAWVMTKAYGNPSSLHRKGLEAESILATARGQIAKTLQAEPKELLFTSGGTESNNLAILGVAKAYQKRGKHLITTAIEHPAVANPYQMLKNLGWQVDVLPVDQTGKIDVAELKSLLRPETILVSVMLVNNEVGTIQPIQEIGKLLAQTDHKIYFHVDAVQAYGKLALKPKAWGVDLLSASGHKIHGPKGVGFLYVAKGVRLLPLVGGGGQEQNYRSGTENLPGIAGFALAATLAYKDISEAAQQIEAVRACFLEALANNLDHWQINGAQDGLPAVLNISFAETKSEVLLHMLETKGVYVSAGSACSAKKNVLSPVLLAMGLPRPEIEGAIRFSFSAYTTLDEAKAAGQIVAETVLELRKILNPQATLATPNKS